MTGGTNTLATGRTYPGCGLFRIKNNSAKHPIRNKKGGYTLMRIHPIYIEYMT